MSHGLGLLNISWTCICWRWYPQYLGVDSIRTFTYIYQTLQKIHGRLMILIQTEFGWRNSGATECKEAQRKPWYTWSIFCIDRLFVLQWFEYTVSLFFFPKEFKMSMMVPSWKRFQPSPMWGFSFLWGVSDGEVKKIGWGVLRYLDNWIELGYIIIYIRDISTVGWVHRPT